MLKPIQFKTYHQDFFKIYQVMLGLTFIFFVKPLKKNLQNINLHDVVR